MAKRHRQIRGKGQNYEVSEQLDDLLLPTPEEILKYKEADESLPQFIQETGRLEQQYRHGMNEKGLKLSFREQFFTHGLNYLGMTFAFLMGAGGLWFSYELLKLGFDVQGTIFSGATMVYMAFLFLKRVKINGGNSK